MKYNELILNYLSSADETVRDFAKKAGVHRSSVYRARNGKDMSFHLIEKMVNAAGGEVVILARKKAKANENQMPS